MFTDLKQGNGRSWSSTAIVLRGLLAVVVGLLPTMSALATFPGANGKIAFTSYRTGNGDIYVMNADGTGQTQLTSDPGLLEQGAFWSPDGMEIAFSTWDGTTGDLYLMNADGGNVRLLLTDAQWPTWSPDGSKIAFQRCPFCEDIWVMNVDGTGLRQLTNHVDREMWPDWSPDGTQIVYHRNDAAQIGDIYVMNADGSNQTRLTNHPSNDYFASWSPDGKRIAFTSQRSGNGDIWVMNADGTGPSNLTNHPAYEQYPAWSPDGAKIVFESYRSGDSELYVKDADGGNLVRLTNVAGSDFAPAWQSIPAGAAAELAVASVHLHFAPGVEAEAGQPDEPADDAVAPRYVGEGKDFLRVRGTLDLSEESDGIDPMSELVTFSAGIHAVEIPAGSFRWRSQEGAYGYAGDYKSGRVWILLAEPSGYRDTWGYRAGFKGVDNSGTGNPITVTLGIGDDRGETQVKLFGTLGYREH